MPFTGAHPAIILPLTRLKRVSVTALVAGSIVPDFEFFLQMREVPNIGHYWYGILLFDLPMALVFCYMFHNLLRNLLIENLPLPFQNKFASAPDFNWNVYAAQNRLVVFTSLLIGIASHILWDGFTHEDGMFVAILPLLSAKTGITHFNMPVYYLLQVIFSLAGLAVVIVTIIRIPNRVTGPRGQKTKIYWPALITFIITLAGIRLVGWPQYNSFWGVFMAIMGSICYSWLLVSLLIKKISFKKASV